MHHTIRAGAALVLAASLLGGCSKKEDEAIAAKAAADARAAEALVREKEAQETAVEAYIYAYPLVTMELTRRVMTNVDRVEPARAPMGQFARLRSYPAVDDHAVTAPNADTLYTIVWLDVSKEPWVVSLPDMKNRFALFPMLDGWTTVFADPGKRTTGTKPQKLAITGPGWSGTLPAGVTEYKSPTGMVWVLGRIYCSGTRTDYAAVHALQDKISAVPLSALGGKYTPPPAKIDPAVDMKTAVREQVNALDGAAFFKLFATLLKTNPPTAADAPFLPKLAKLGIVPGRDFDPGKLDPAVAKGIAAAPKPAQGKIMAWLKEGIVAGDMKVENGWVFTTKAGTYGTNYKQRALITAIGLGANLPQDAIYPLSEGPRLVEKYSGAKKYVLHFPKGQLPPVNGFWSLTMYDAAYFFVPNALHRYTLSQRDRLKPNRDGSIDLYIQKDAPAKARTSNWLPAPPGPFLLMLRLYWPKEKPPSIIDGTWKLPEVKEGS
jgi:hypothetical protein